MCSLPVFDTGDRCIFGENWRGSLSIATNQVVRPRHVADLSGSGTPSRNRGGEVQRPGLACTSPRGADGEVIVTFHETEPRSVLVERGDRMVLGTQVRAASGAKYEGPNLMFWEHQGEAQVAWMNVELKCNERK